MATQNVAKATRLRIALVALTAGLVPFTGRAQTYNSITDFSPFAGGPWSYRTQNGAMIYDATRYGGAWRLSTGDGDWCYVAATHQHPGTGSGTCDSVRRWTAPTTGTITISGNSRATGAYGGDGARVIVKHNTTELVNELVPAEDTVIGKRWHITRYVVANDTIDTILNKNGDYVGDQQYISQTITYQPVYNSSNDSATLRHTTGATGIVPER